jgi:VIT1/CCC1 family predicted Fe2+/Mn2+ transporter
MADFPTHKNEPHKGGSQSRSNWLRAAVLGANDGIVSLAALVVGVASTLTSSYTLFLTGIAGLLAGALSMALGEYVSVSSQRDTERALLEKERHELENSAEHELLELAHLYEKKGLTPETAQKVAEELTEHDVFAAHVDIELGIDPNNLTSPIHAAFASGLAFSIGAIIPLIAILIAPAAFRIPATFGAVLVALIGTGVLSARASGTKTIPATTRIVLGGMIAMAITFSIGSLIGTPV